MVASSGSGEPRGIAIVSANSIWVVGNFINSTGSDRAVIEHWNGTCWSVVLSPNPSASQNILDAAAANPRSGQTWAVGDFFNTTSAVLQTLTELHPQAERVSAALKRRLRPDFRVVPFQCSPQKSGPLSLVHTIALERLLVISGSMWWASVGLL